MAYLAELCPASGDAEVVLVDVLRGGQEVQGSLQLHHHIPQRMAACMYVCMYVCMYIFYTNVWLCVCVCTYV